MTRGRIITVLFTDLVGSTRTMVELGPQRADAFRREHDRCVASSMRRHGGEVVKSTGDGLMAVFDSAVGAVGAALDAQRSADRLASRWPDVAVGVRVGLSIGEAREDQGDWHGRTVVEAARLCDLAAAGQILVTPVVRQLAESAGEHAFDAVGTRELKGIGPLECHEVVHPLPRPTDIRLPAGLAQALDPVFVGRGGELQRLSDARDLVSAGGRRLAFVSGEAGIGKSRLVAEAAFDAVGAGWTVLHGRCERDLAAPFQPFVEALEPVVEHSPSDVLAEHVDRYGAELGRLFPRLGSHLDRSDADALDQETAQLRLFRSVAAMVRSTTNDSPTMLVVEDVHWGPTATLALLTHIVSDPEPARLLVVATSRSTDVEPRSAADSALGELVGRPESIHLALHGLDRQDVEELVDTMSEGSRDHRGDLVEAVHDNSGGNPLFAVHLARHLGELGSSRSDWHEAGAPALVGAAVPSGVKSLVRSRLTRLDESVVSLLSAASVLGADFSVDLLGRVTRREPDDLLDVLDPLVGAGFVQECAGMPGWYEFSHPVVRSVLRNEMSDARRARTHARTAEAMSGAARPTDAATARLAWHACQGVAGGSPPSLAVTASVQAAELATDRLDAAEGLSRLDAAETAVRGVDLDASLRFELLAARLRVHERLLDTAAIRDSLVAALDVAVDAGEPEWAGRLKVLAALGQQNTDDPELYERLQAVLDLLGETDSPVRARVLALMAWREIIAGRAAEAEPAARTAREIGERRGLPDEAAGTCLVHGLTLLRPGRLDAAIAALRRAIEWTDRGDRGWECTHYRLSAMRFLGIADLTRGDRRHLDEHLGVVEEEADAAGSRVSQAHCRQIRTMIAMLDGDLGAAEESAGRILDVAGDEPSYQLAYATQLQAIRREQDRSAELLPLVEGVAAAEPDNAPVRAILSQMLVETGDRERGAALLAEVVDQHVSHRVQHWLGPLVLCVLADVAAQLDDRDSAARLEPMLVEYRGLAAVAPTGLVCMGAVDRFLGQLHLTLGAADTAAEHLRAATDLERRLAAPICLARSLMWLTRTLDVLDLRDGPTGGDAVWQEAHDIAERLALDRLSPQIEAR